MRRLWMLLPVSLSLCLALGVSLSVQSPVLSLALPEGAFSLPVGSLSTHLDTLEEEVHQTYGRLDLMDRYIAEQAAVLESQRDRLQALVRETGAYRELSDGIYEQRIIRLLGDPVGITRSAGSTVMVFDFHQIEYRGYVAKVTPHQPGAVGVRMAPEGGRETTSAAAARSGAVLAINGGGFYGASSGDRTVYRPLGNTVVDGALVGDFVPSYRDICFVGVTRENVLVGGVLHTEEDLAALGAYAGVTFVPELLRDGEKTAIPSQWAGARQPRTILGEYPNGDLLFIVIDGRQSDWSAGVTLEEAQEVLIRLGIRRAYNLDGGGSTAMYYDGEILNRPSDGRERPVVTHIVVR